MSITSTFTFTVRGENHYELVSFAEERIAEFFEIEVIEVQKKLSYELNIKENQDMSSDYAYEAEIIVRGRDV